MFSRILTPEQVAEEKAEQERELRIAELKRQLAETDYVGLADYDKDQPELKAQRQAWRDEIRALQPSPPEEGPV
jgi:hypothetical protein